MADPNSPVKAPAQQSEEKGSFLEAGAEGKSAMPPAFGLTSAPVQQKGVAQLKAIDYTTYVNKAEVLLKEILKYKDMVFPSEEMKAIKGHELAELFREVQGAGGITSEFLTEIKARMGASVFDGLVKSLNDMGLTWALDGATGIRVKNMTDSQVTASGGGQAFSIRSSPKAKDSSNILGDLNHTLDFLGPFKHIEYDKESGTEFLGIKLRREAIPSLKLASGKKPEDIPEVVYVGMGGLRVTVTWDVFLEQLSNFDTLTSGMTLGEKLTKLRQFGQKGDMGEQMDSELGTPRPVHGPQYEEFRGSSTNIFQMLKEVDQVETPLGVVDMQHFLIAIESYQKKNKDVVLDPWWITFGKMQDAGSFAGNIGAAAGDYVVKASSDYEKSVGKGASEETLMRFYYDTRTTEAELLGELDAWGALPTLEGAKVSTLTDLIKGYYGAGVPKAGSGKDHPRKAAMQGFMANYGLTSAGNTLNNPTNVAIIYPINLQFAQGWWRNREGIYADTDPKKLEAPSKKMTEWFLDFLTKKALEYKVF